MGVVGAQIVFDEPLCRRRLGERTAPPATASRDNARMIPVCTSASNYLMRRASAGAGFAER